MNCKTSLTLCLEVDEITQLKQHKQKQMNYKTSLTLCLKVNEITQLKEQ